MGYVDGRYLLFFSWLPSFFFLSPIQEKTPTFFSLSHIRGYTFFSVLIQTLLSVLHWASDLEFLAWGWLFCQQYHTHIHMCLSTMVLSIMIILDLVFTKYDGVSGCWFLGDFILSFSSTWLGWVDH